MAQLAPPLTMASVITSNAPVESSHRDAAGNHEKPQVATWVTLSVISMRKGLIFSARCHLGATSQQSLHSPPDVP